MLRNTSLRFKVLMLPAVAALAFAVILGVTSSATRRNDGLLSGIEQGQQAALALSRDVEVTLTGVSSAIRRAVPADDSRPLDDAIASLERLSAKLQGSSAGGGLLTDPS